MFGAIILRNLPRQEIQIDLGRVEVKGWYRGFGMVPPGLHYVSTEVNGHTSGFWCWVRAGEAVVRVYDHDQQTFIEDTPEASLTFSQMVRNDMMTRSLIPYNMRLYNEWSALTHHITPEALPPVLAFADDEVVGQGTRFENAFYGTHRGSARAFLTELQFSFLCWQLDWSCCESGAKERWTHLLTAISRAGVRHMHEQPALFVAVVEVLMAQFDALYGGPLLVALAEGIIEDMTATNRPELMEKATAFADFIHSARRAAG
jgi:hypothetical protein